MFHAFGGSNALENTPKKHEIRIFNQKFKIPQSRLMRRILGYSLIVGGMLGFLPILGYWMIPVGLFILSHDSPRIRRWRRKQEVNLLRWWHSTRFSKSPEKGQNRRKSTKKMTKPLRIT